MASLGLWTLPFCSLARMSPTFSSVASFPIQSTLLFSSDSTSTERVFFSPSCDHYNSETAGASCWSPRTWYMDGNLGLCAEDAAPRSFARRDSVRPNRVRTRQEVKLAGPALCRLLYNPAKELTQASQTRLVRSALRQHAVFCQPRAPHVTASLREQPANASVPPLHLFVWCFRQARSNAPGHTHGNRIPRQEARFDGPAL